MLSFIYKQKLVFSLFLVWAIFLGIKPNLGFAGLIGSKTGIEEERALYLEKIKTFLQDEKVAKYTHKFGMDREILVKRIGQLDTEKLRELALRCDMFKVGGGGGVVVFTLVVLLLIFVILYITNYTVKIEPRDSVPRRY